MSIVNAYPVNDETTLYLPADRDRSLGELIDDCIEHFGGDIKLCDLNIRASKIHTRCITYDLYDPSDYDDYIIINKC